MKIKRRARKLKKTDRMIKKTENIELPPKINLMVSKKQKKKKEMIKKLKIY